MTGQQQDIKVSVCMITYNHEAYIEQAIESIMMQQTSFRYELVIGEDCSKDNTREICLRMKDKYPERIQLLSETENKGAVQNVLAVWRACAGKYIAMCEGDDYWIDSLKLQKQFDVLEKDSEVSMVFHNVWMYYQDKDTKVIFGQYSKDTYTFADIVGKWLISTPSVMYRNQLLFPDWYNSIFYGDIILFLMNAQLGKVFYLDETMAVYRVHGTSATNSISAEGNFKKLINDYSFMLSSFKAPYKKYIRRELGQLHYRLARTQLKDNKRKEARLHLVQYFKHTLRVGDYIPFSILKTYLSLIVKQGDQ
ncbi:MAG: glycosyltransferase [Chitinophagaceae bacterium]|nr:glycosyltransferase [Chitinophagaceae bacterium]